MAALFFLLMLHEKETTAVGLPPARSAAEQDRMGIICQERLRNGLLGGGGAALLMSAAFPKGSVGRICAVIPGIVATLTGLVMAIASRFFNRDTRYAESNLPALRGGLLCLSFAQILRHHELDVVERHRLVPREVLRAKLKGELFIGDLSYLQWVDREGDAWVERGLLDRPVLEAIRRFTRSVPGPAGFGNRFRDLQVELANL